MIDLPKGRFGIKARAAFEASREEEAENNKAGIKPPCKCIHSGKIDMGAYVIGDTQTCSWHLYLDEEVECTNWIRPGQGPGWDCNLADPGGGSGFFSMGWRFQKICNGCTKKPCNGKSY